LQAGPDTEIAFLGSGETKIELICNRSNAEVNVGKDISWGFEVSSLDEMMKIVQDRGVSILSEPLQPNEHVRFFYVRDPNGLKIQFVENL
jgi:lactoylglutathione lyase